MFNPSDDGNVNPGKAKEGMKYLLMRYESFTFNLFYCTLFDTTLERKCEKFRQEKAEAVKWRTANIARTLRKLNSTRKEKLLERRIVS